MIATEKFSCISNDWEPTGCVTLSYKMWERLDSNMDYMKHGDVTVNELPQHVRVEFFKADSKDVEVTENQLGYFRAMEELEGYWGIGETQENDSETEENDPDSTTATPYTTPVDPRTPAAPRKRKTEEDEDDDVFVIDATTTPKLRKVEPETVARSLF